MFIHLFLSSLFSFTVPSTESYPMLPMIFFFLGGGGGGEVEVVTGACENVCILCK